jgi:predicted P-loop ATPase
MIGASKADWNHWDLVLGVGPDLLPVVPDPAAPVSAGSKLKGKLGKVPSSFDGEGNAHGLRDWPSRVISPADIARWSADPRLSMCVRCSAVRAIDADVANPELARAIAARIARHVALPKRTRSNSSKFLLPFRLAGNHKKRVIVTTGGKIECLMNGQQFVVAGSHSSGVPYQWEGGRPEEIPELSIDEFKALWADLKAEFSLDPAEQTTEQTTDLDSAPERLTSATEEQLAHLDLALAHPPLRRAAGEEEFCVKKILYPLLSLGDVGRDRFLDFCANADDNSANPDPQWPETTWNAHITSAPPESDFRSIYKTARELGWENPGIHTPIDATAFDLVPDNANKAQPKKSTTATILKLMTNKEGKPLSNAANAKRAIEQILYGKLTHDEFLDRVMVHWPEADAPRAWRDEDATRLQIQLQQIGMITMSATAVRDAVELIAKVNRSNVIADWLSTLQWDGNRRLSLLMSQGFGTPPTRHYLRSSRNMLIALVARAMQPSCQVDTAFVFEGPQGTFKSSALRIIGSEYFQELTADPNSKDFEQQLRGVWLGEFAELNAIRRTEDIARIKQFITNRVDHYRPSYGRTERDFPRRIVFCGTTNEKTWIHDQTGPRRFIPIEVGKINLQWLTDNREQLFAEAAAEYKAGRKWWIWPSIETQELQEDRQAADPWEERIRDYLRGRTEIADLTELLNFAIDIAVDRQTQAHLTRVGILLRKLGCVKQTRRRVNGLLRRPWTIPPEFSQQDCIHNGPILDQFPSIQNSDLV